MADANRSLADRAEKLAAARRKLKQFQKKHKGHTSEINGDKTEEISSPSSWKTNPYQQNYVYDSGTGDPPPTWSNVPVSEPSYEYIPVVANPEPQPPFYGGFAQNPNDFFDNLPSIRAAEATSDDIVASEMPECDISNQNVPECDINTPNVPIEDSLISSSTESLRQLSLQINGLVEDNVTPTASSSTELERRNQELAAMLAEKDLKIENLQLQVKEYQSRVSQLLVDMDQVQAESQTKITKELQPIQDQLQTHIQTVGILVGEKTELQATLTKTQQLVKQKTAELEDVQGRLKASRHKVSELEKEVKSLTVIKEQLEMGNGETDKELDKLKAENSALNQQLEEMQLEASELREKLNSRSNECAFLQQEVQAKQSQIELLELKVQQLNTCDRPDADQVLETMHQQKVALEWQVSELQQTVKSLSADRDQATQQYQDYLQQFNAQLKSMADKLSVSTAENEQLVNREQGLVRHISELEKQLQQLLQRPKEEPRDMEQEHEMTAELEALRAEKQDLSTRLETQLQEKASLERELEEGARKIEELEAILEAQQADQPDKNKLLATMESDKVAAAQAVAQNQKLKNQVEELQDTFVKVSNDKMELTERLQHEQHLNKELEEKLVQQTEELRAQLEAKDREREEIWREISNKVKLQETELQQAKLKIEDLSFRNSDLEKMLKEQGEKKELQPSSEPVSDIEKQTAMQKLEERFTKTMHEVAELTEEKQRLEHLVVQLQEETETIGEYVALYQKQRCLLRERAREKDEQLNRLQKDREQLRAKLNELTGLIQQLVTNKQEEPVVHEEQIDHSKDVVNGDVEKPEEKKIMALLSDISSTALAEPITRGPEGFHPCPLCSGRLITV